MSPCLSNIFESACPNSPAVSREALEKERVMVEKQMQHLDEKRIRKLVMMQKGKLYSLEASNHSQPSIPSIVYTDGSSARCSSKTNDYDKRKCCAHCSRKDRIIHRQEQQIKSLIKQLHEIELQAFLPFEELALENDAGSEVSSIHM
mmetsp:Transcript_11786/g.18102  ORF Transcript_11786/g.18102 Transcript_11786/m.18102 type:complete len:147 (-) Transcript_11786:1638-2078(-)